MIPELDKLNEWTSGVVVTFLLIILAMILVVALDDESYLPLLFASVASILYCFHLLLEKMDFWVADSHNPQPRATLLGIMIALILAAAFILLAR
jgi:hypothetical protein